MTIIAITATATLAFLIGIVVGIYVTCKTIASGKVENVKVVG
jgi:uncharacterized protein YneF (UPF0154 family)